MRVVAIMFALGVLACEPQPRPPPAAPRPAPAPPAAAPVASPPAQRSAAQQPAARPGSWAQPLVVHGLPNLHKVNDGLYRGAQPTAAGMRELETMKIRTVINLRSSHSDTTIIGDRLLAYEHIPMRAWRIKDEDVVTALQLIADPANHPVFVHCQHGADRTGVVTAVYRIAIEGWTKDDAIREMTDGGFGYHAIWQNLIVYLQQLDVPRLRREAGLGG